MSFPLDAQGREGLLVARLLGDYVASSQGEPDHLLAIDMLQRLEWNAGREVLHLPPSPKKHEIEHCFNSGGDLQPYIERTGRSAGA